MNALRSIPSVDKCLKEAFVADPGLAKAPRPYLKELIKRFQEEKRNALKAGEELSLENWKDALLAYLKKGLTPNLRRVINATGVIVHTNLGRSILAKEAQEAVAMAASGYCNLEMNLESGDRGGRHTLINDLVRFLSGAEDAIVVNNNAAAVLLVLDTLCSGGETIVSRGELVEIGGGFRVPDIMAKSGAILREVGTTNRARPDDYRDAINENTKAIMKVHASNFRITGHHSAVDITDLKTLAREYDLPLIMDLGSGVILDFSASGLPPEPSIREVIAKGADLVCFSGDKVLGGPQAGIIAGKTELVAKLKKNPLARALRCDKLCLAALEATLRLYLEPEVAKIAVPSARMMSKTAAELKTEARALAAKIRRAFARANIACEIRLREADSRVGGGGYPEHGLPTTLLALRPEKFSVNALRKRLLSAAVPLVGRVEAGDFCLDPRTLAKSDYPVIVKELEEALR